MIQICKIIYYKSLGAIDEYNEKFKCETKKLIDNFYHLTINNGHIYVFLFFLIFLFRNFSKF